MEAFVFVDRRLQAAYVNSTEERFFSAVQAVPLLLEFIDLSHSWEMSVASDLRLPAKAKKISAQLIVLTLFYFHKVGGG